MRRYTSLIAISAAIVCALVSANAPAFTPMAASGSTHTLFLSESGLVRAVGANGSGQLGDGSTTPSTSGVTVGLTGVVMIAAGSVHSLALKGDGTVWAWGANDAGQLGLGDTAPRTSPVQVAAIAGIVAISAGDQHSLALKSDGTVYAWGLNSHSQTGGPCASIASNTLTPRLVVADLASPAPCTPGAALSSIVQIAAGGAFSLALRSDGSVFAWGDNTFGQLGDGSTADSDLPGPVVAVNATAIAAGGNHALALKPDTRAVAWGRNNAGQLGNDTNTDSSTPVDVSLPPAPPLPALPTKAIAILAAGSEHSLIVYQTGPVAAFGNGSAGQLGTGTANSLNVAVEVGGYTDAAGIFAGPMANRSFVYRPGHGVFGAFQGFGSDANGEIGLGVAGPDVLSPTQVIVVTGVGDKIGKRTNFRVDASRSDLFWRHSSSVNATWDYTGNGPVDFTNAGLPSVPANWRGLATADVNGDGISDVVWLDNDTGQVAIWLMSGPATISAVTFPQTIGAGSPWQFAGAGDFDGDGRADLLWRNSVTGEVVAWYFGVGGQFEQVVSIGAVSPASWQIVAIADVNGDSIADIVWLRVSDGQVAIWRMARTGHFQGLFPAAVGPGSSWRIYRAGDFDGDGRDDLFWRNEADGTNAIWYLAGGNQIQAPQFFVGTPLAQWRIDATGDFDGDGHDDLMWTDVTSGFTLRWLMGPRNASPVTQPVVGTGGGWQAVQ